MFVLMLISLFPFLGIDSRPPPRCCQTMRLSALYPLQVDDLEELDEQ